MLKEKLRLSRKSEVLFAGFCMCLDTEVNDARVFLHEHEFKYFATLKIAKRSKSYLLGRVAAKQALGVLMDINDFENIHISYGIFQFPIVKHPSYHNIQVSISHCENVGLALAFTEEHPMGIDIEKIDATKTDVFKAYISNKELDLFQGTNLSISETCTAVWTIKEGLSKILKTGLTADFHVLEIQSLQKKEFFYTSTFQYFGQYKALTYRYEDYFISIVLPRNTNLDSENFDKLFKLN